MIEKKKHMDSHAKLLHDISTGSNELPPYAVLSGYNIFSILGVNAKEVVMCRFLADLLNPEGQHGYGILFLKTFLHNVLKNCRASNALLSHTKILTEFAIEHDRRIDIVIQNSSFLIPLEVKIYADEQEGQCYDYYKYAKNAPMVYLTRFGSTPSEYSRKKKGGTEVLSLGFIRCISWSEDIYGWLESLFAKLNEPVRSVVAQYMDSIRMIADRRDKMIMEKCLEALYKSPEYFKAGLEIAQSMKTAKLRLMRLVFEDFKTEMEKIEWIYGLELEQVYHYYVYDDKCHEKFYDSDNTTYPGLNYVVKKAAFQKDSIQMWFRIEVEYNLLGGITLFDTKANPQNESLYGCEVDEITAEMLEEAGKYLNKDIFMPVGWWITWCYPNGKWQDGYYDDVPDFKHMNPCAVQLVDRKVREAYVKNAVKNFEKYILKYLL